MTAARGTQRSQSIATDTGEVRRPERVPQRPKLERITLAPTEIVPDPENRKIELGDDFEGLVDSVRVLGVLAPVVVRRLEDGRFQLVDGERRWRAAVKAGLPEVVCEVFPEGESGTATLAGLVLNEHREAPGCLHVARRLREIKNELGFTHEALARHAGMPVDRVKSYFALFAASDFILSFCESQALPLKVAVELARFEKATNGCDQERLVRKEGGKSIISRNRSLPSSGCESRPTKAPVWQVGNEPCDGAGNRTVDA